jgi:peptidoglycan/LPS O-acetylase OafA/YrhL
MHFAIDNLGECCIDRPSPKPPFYRYLNVPSWSVSCEWFFYLCAPFVLYALAGRYLRIALIALVTVYACALGWFIAGGSEVSKLFYVSWLVMDVPPVSTFEAYQTDLIAVLPVKRLKTPMNQVKNSYESG